MDEPSIAGRASGVWVAIAWAEGLLLLGLAAAGLAVASSLPSCVRLAGCPPGETSFGGASIVFLVFSGVALAIGVFMASSTSGWSRARAAVQSAAALAAGAAAALLGGVTSVALVDELLPALVLAVGVAGIVAIRPSYPGAVRPRLVVLAIFVILAVGLASAAALVILLTVLTLPAIGAVESALGSAE